MDRSPKYGRKAEYGQQGRIKQQTRTSNLICQNNYESRTWTSHVVWPFVNWTVFSRHLETKMQPKIWLPSFSNAEAKTIALPVFGMNEEYLFWLASEPIAERDDKKQFKEAWSSCNVKAVKWYWRPLACCYAIIAVALCFFGFHDVEIFLRRTQMHLVR